MEIVCYIIFLILLGLGLYFYFDKKHKTQQEALENAKKNQEMREHAEKELKILYDKLKVEYNSNGLPIVQADNIALTKNELCHYTGFANYGKIKTSTTGYQAGSRGVSLHIMKGVSYRVGNFQGHAIKSDTTDSESGTIYITNKKIIFSAPKNSCTIRLNKIILLDTYENYIKIQTETKNYFFNADKNLEFLVILETLINNLVE